MTLQEKIDKLPLSIEYEGVTNELELIATADYVQVLYSGTYYGTYARPIHTLLLCERLDLDDNRTLSESLEYVVDRALKVIENKKWNLNS